MATRKTIIISGSLTFLGLIVILFSLQGVTHQADGDIYASEYAWWCFNVTSKMYDLQWNVTDLLITEPESPTYIYYYNTTNKRYQLINTSNWLQKGTAKYRYCANITKRPLQTIKVYSKQLGIADPYIFGVKPKLDTYCLKNKTNTIINESTCKNYNQWYNVTIDCSYPHNSEREFKNGTVQCFHDYNESYRNESSCKTYKEIICVEESKKMLRVGDKWVDPIKDLHMNCKQDKTLIICDECFEDGNCDGIIQSGESATIIDGETIITEGYHKEKQKEDLKKNGID